MVPIFRPTAPKIFEPLNPEYSLLDSIVTEGFQNDSTECMWWSFERVSTEEKMDSLDGAYGEHSSSKSKDVYTGPFRVYAKIEVNPIIQELLRLGHQTIEQIDIYCNVAAMSNYLDKREPKAGDILRTTYILDQNNRRFLFYTVSNVTPIDIFNFKYTNWQIMAEQTLLSGVPEEIRTYSKGE